VMLHANMRGYPKKVESFKSHGLWFLDEMNQDLCLPQPPTPHIQQKYGAHHTSHAQRSTYARSYIHSLRRNV